MSFKTLMANIATPEILRLIDTAQADSSDLKPLRKELQERLPEQKALNQAIFSHIGLEGYERVFSGKESNWKGMLDRDFFQAQFDAALKALPVENDLKVNIHEYVDPGNNWSGSFLAEDVRSVKLDPISLETVDRLVAFIAIAKVCDLAKTGLLKTVQTAVRSISDVHFGKFPANSQKLKNVGKYGKPNYLDHKTEEAAKALRQHDKPIMATLAFKLEQASEGLFAPEARVKLDERFGRFTQWRADEREAELKLIDEAIAKATPNATKAFDKVAALIAKYPDEELDSRYRLINEKGVMPAFIAAIAMDVPTERVSHILDCVKPAAARP